MELHNGDRMTAAEFHKVYERMPPDFKAELIGGIVYVASPLSRQHGTPHLVLGTLFGTYGLKTPGVEASDNTTVLLGTEGEPQPDLYLRILPEYGGQSRSTKKGYVKGAPELIAEVAYSSRSIDLHAKRQDYKRYGVREYLVLSVREGRVRWFDLPADRELEPDTDGVIRVHSFPGLWIDVAALLKKDRKLLTVLEQGLATPEHAAFVASLAAAHKQLKKSAARKKRRGPGRNS
jgi:Uma2 family endonuclease